ncbi:unnamed protein product [Schistosoma mansoni]|uniref:Smp_202740 n=1 Tax=Schistosoma mansoni TaxID=6183 RepID=UPI00022C82C5|nr:unnamed protein product [Schistosoma mansoni]|eukprot:XP_018645657.1 unnamed protein product [Schistosoma mansoni]
MKFQVTRLFEIVCNDLRKPTKACLAYVLMPELAITHTLRATKSKMGIINYRFYKTIQRKFVSQTKYVYRCSVFTAPKCNVTREPNNTWHECCEPDFLTRYKRYSK